MRLIDADALMKEFTEFVKDSNNSDFADVPTWNDAVSLVGSMPSVQPEIIRCKNCEYWWNKCLCKIFSKYGSIKTYEDDFCSYGERREDATF